MTGGEIHYKGWRIDIMYRSNGWEALIYRPNSPLHEMPVPKGPERRIVIEAAKTFIDRCSDVTAT
jgi:hypothetical protein